MKKFGYILILVLLGFAACKKDEESNGPVITFISISPNSLVQYSEPVYIRIGYTDLNGDIGFENPAMYALSVKDNRLANPDFYHVPPLAPIGSNVAIQGELEIKINTLFLLGNGTEELTSFTLKIQDRAGNWSEEISTAQVTIRDSI